MSNGNTPPTSALPLTFGGFTIPAGCRRIFITAELEPSNGDPRIQPTGFPDIGPVLYPDPAGKDGLICLIESEASMANWLEAVCVADKYVGTLKSEFTGLPYIKLTDTGLPNGVFKTSSTIDGHRFASEYVLSGQGRQSGEGAAAAFTSYAAPDNGTSSFLEFIFKRLEMPDKKHCPAANVPRIFKLAAEFDPLSLIHGFQVSSGVSFVGLRSPRALTASIVGLQCDRVVVPGVRIDPISEGDANQAIFQKQRITAKTIEARFSIDVGLLTSLQLDSPRENGEPGALQAARAQLLLAIALWKVGTFLDLLKVELSLRTECKLRLKRCINKKKETVDGKDVENEVKVIVAPQVTCESSSGRSSGEFPCEIIARAALATHIATAFPGTSAEREARSPLNLKYKKPRKEESGDNQNAPDNANP